MKHDIMAIRNNLTKDGRILKQFGYIVPGNDDEEDIDEEEVQEIVEFLKHHPIFPKPKKRRKISTKDVYYLEDNFSMIDVYYLGQSYSLKHIFSRFLRSQYCTNGDFIAACIDAGFIVEPIPESPNANIFVPCDRFVGRGDYYITVQI